MSTKSETTSAMFQHPLSPLSPLSDSSTSFSKLSDRSSSYCESPHLRQHSGSGESSHLRQVSNMSGQSFSDHSFSWTCSSRHSRQSSQLSGDSFGPPQHQRYSSKDSGHSFENRAYDMSPVVTKHRRQYHQSEHQHSRQSSYEVPPPGVHIDLSRPYSGHVSSPTPPAFKMPPNYPKYSPISQDQGYHTMVGPQSSPDISPGASMDMSSLTLSCPPGASRPRPPDVPDVKLDHRNIIASFRKNTSCSRMGIFETLTDDLILKILSHVDSVTRVRCGQVCRRFYLLAWDPAIWTSLTLSGDTLDTDLAVKSVLTCLTRDSGRSGRYSRVSRINLTYCTRLSDAGLSVISRTCPGLNSLEIRSCKLVTNTGVADIVTRCTRLQHLDITGQYKSNLFLKYQSSRAVFLNNKNY